ncbi:MAG: YhbY family RNA-binding protein [Candidatus Thorarchaeota archaeon]
MTDYQKEFKTSLISKPNCILGKKGITKDFVEHLNKLLKKYKIIKIKALRSVANKSTIKELANSITNLTNSYLLDLRGRMMIISLLDINKIN